MTVASKALSIQYNNPTNLKETNNIMSKIAAIIFDGDHIEKIIKFSTIDSSKEESYNKKGNDNVVK